jgi:hypothetical protein
MPGRHRALSSLLGIWLPLDRARTEQALSTERQLMLVSSRTRDPLPFDVGRTAHRPRAQRDPTLAECCDLRAPSMSTRVDADEREPMRTPVRPRWRVTPALCRVSELDSRRTDGGGEGCA